MKAVNGDEDCMIMTNDGIVIRISLKQVSVYSRSAAGVKLIHVSGDSKVQTISILEPEEDEETVETADKEKEEPAKEAETPETDDDSAK